MMKTTHYDVHVADANAGHVHSDDCWCEPLKSYWIPGQDGKMLHVLEHNDNRTESPDWVLRCLDGIGKD